ncbi:hypothetical protein [Leptospira santarosai]|nr:hypothetical protein [Leptospira santarosai]
MRSRALEQDIECNQESAKECGCHKMGKRVGPPHDSKKELRRSDV